MRADNVAAPVTPQQWNYIHAMGVALRSSLDNVTAVFAPSCIGHAVLTKRDWTTLKIDYISLPAALRCWEHSTRLRKGHHDKFRRSTEATVPHKNHNNNKRRHDKQHKEKQRAKVQKNSNNGSNNNNNGERKRLTKPEREERKRLRHEQQKRREERRNRRKNNMVAYHDSNLTNYFNLRENSTDARDQTQQQNNINKRKRNELEKQKRKQNKQNKRHRRKKEQNVGQRERELEGDQPILVVVEKRAEISNRINRRSGVPRVPERCSLRILERCSWPQCNNSCPILTNPVTGEELRFLELLTSFGLDIEAVAAALGVDMQTLSNMDRIELVNMLTQQVS